jgi:hypothetical protein
MFPSFGVVPQNDVPNDDPVLAAFLTDRDVPCPHCSYNLRGLSRPLCPECGKLIQLTVGAVDPSSPAWIAMVAVLCGAGGIGGVLIYFSIREGIPMHMGWLTWQYVCFYAIMACAPASVAAIFVRRPFQRLRPTHQWRIAMPVIVMTALLFILPVIFS